MNRLHQHAARLKISPVARAICFFTFLVCFVPFAHAANVPSSEDDAFFSSRIQKIENRLKVLLENQKVIAVKNKEIDLELDNLRIWINRR